MSRIFEEELFLLPLGKVWACGLGGRPGPKIEVINSYRTLEVEDFGQESVLREHRNLSGKKKKNKQPKNKNKQNLRSWPKL